MKSMHYGNIVSVIVVCFILAAGCTQFRGCILSVTLPIPLSDNGSAGNCRASDRHLIIYENQTFYSTNFFLGRGETTDNGTWTKKEPGLYTMRSVTGEITDWMYDSFDDSMYMTGFPQMKYHRYKG